MYLSNYYSLGTSQNPYYILMSQWRICLQLLVQSIIFVLHLIDSLGGLLLISAVSKQLLLLTLENFHSFMLLTYNRMIGKVLLKIGKNQQTKLTRGVFTLRLFFLSIRLELLHPKEFLVFSWILNHVSALTIFLKLFMR